MSEDLTENLAQMRARAEQTRVIVHNQVNRNVLNVASETSFIFKPATETGRFKEVEEARDDPARDINAAEGVEIQRQVSAEPSHDHAEQRQRATTVGAAVC